MYIAGWRVIVGMVPECDDDMRFTIVGRNGETNDHVVITERSGRGPCQKYQCATRNNSAKKR